MIKTNRRSFLTAPFFNYQVLNSNEMQTLKFNTLIKMNMSKILIAAMNDLQCSPLDVSHDLLMSFWQHHGWQSPRCIHVRCRWSRKIKMLIFQKSENCKANRLQTWFCFLFSWLHAGLYWNYLQLMSLVNLWCQSWLARKATLALTFATNKAGFPENSLWFFSVLNFSSLP